MRQPFEKRIIVLRAEEQRQRALALIGNLPMDADEPLQVVVSDYKPPRKPDQNALMWAGPLKDISEQAWIDGKKFSAEAWAELFKREFLPEDFNPDYCREGYQKWTFTPKGDRVLIGSTTLLTVKGFAWYLEQVYAFGANLGVEFHANPNEVTK